MKNIQIIDGALNCSYDIFSVTDEEFKAIFPGEFQDVEFIKDVITRDDGARLNAMFAAIWQRPVDKPSVRGIHGTLFYELEHKKKYYPTKRSCEMVTGLDADVG